MPVGKSVINVVIAVKEIKKGKKKGKKRSSKEQLAPT